MGRAWGWRSAAVITNSYEVCHVFYVICHIGKKPSLAFMLTLILLMQTSHTGRRKANGLGGLITSLLNPLKPKWQIP